MPLKWRDVVLNWINCLLDDIDTTSFTRSGRGRLLARLLKLTSSSGGVTCKEAEVSDSEVMEELTSFIKEHFPSYYLDSELYRVLNEEDSEELLCVLSLILFYCTMRSSTLGWIKDALCSKLNVEMQLRVKKFIEKIPTDNSEITRALIKEATLESGLYPGSSPMMFTYSPKSQQNETPLKCFFEHTPMRQKRSAVDNMEVRKLKLQLDSVTCEYTELHEELIKSQKQLKILNEKYQEKVQELAKLRKEMDTREQEACEVNDKNCCSEVEQKLRNELKTIQNYVKVLEDKVSDLQEENYKLEKRAKHSEHCSADFKKKVDEYESTIYKMKENLQTAEEENKYLIEQNVELRDFIEKQRTERDCSTDIETSVITDLPDSAENLGQAVVDLQLHEQIEENNKLRIQLEEKIKVQVEMQKQLQESLEKLDSLQCEVRRLSLQNCTLEKERCNWNERITEMEALVHRHCEERDAVLKQHEADKQKLKDITEELEASLKTAENLKLSLDNAVTDHCRVANEKELLMSEMNEVKKRLSDEQTKRMAIADELDTSKTSVLKLETDLKTSNYQIVELEKLRCDLSSKCKNYEAQNETLSLKMKEIQCRVKVLEEERDCLLSKLEIEKAVVKELNDAANSLKADLMEQKVANEKLTLQENQLKIDNSTLLQNAKMAENRLLGLEEQKSELCSQLERANIDLVNLKNNSKIENELNQEKIKILQQEIEQLSTNRQSLELQITALEENKQDLIQKLEAVELKLNKEKQNNIELLEEKSKVLQETRENISEAHNKVVEMQTSFNRKLAEVTQERDSMKVNLCQANEDIQTLENSVQKIEGTLKIFQNELHQVLSEFKHVVTNFVNIRDKLLEYESLDKENFDKLFAINVGDTDSNDDKLTVFKGNSTDCNSSVSITESNGMKNLKLFSVTLNVFYDFVLAVCSKYTVLQNEFTQFQSDSNEMKKLNEVLNKQNHSLIADNTSLRSEVQEYKIKEEISKKLDVEVKQLSETIKKLEKENSLLLEGSNKQKDEVEVLHAQNKSLLSRNLNIQDEMKELINQNKQIKECLADTRSSSLKMGEVCWKLISRKHEADVMFEKVFVAKDQLSQKLTDAQSRLNIVEATYGKQISTLSLADNIRALKLENEAKLSCVEKEFCDLTKEALHALHLCLDQSKKNIDQYEIVFKNISKIKFKNTSKDEPDCENDFSSVESAPTDRCEAHNFTDSFDFITLTELTLQSIESRISDMSSQMELVLEKCKSLEVKCRETFDVKPGIMTSSSSLNVSEMKQCPHRDCDLSSEDDGWNPEDSLEPKTSPQGVTDQQHSFDKALRKEDLEKTLSQYKVKTEELNKELLSVKLSLSVRESEKSELQKKLKEMEQNCKMKEESYLHLRASYAALKSEHSSAVGKISEKENDVLEQKKANMNLNNLFQKQMEKKSTEIREEYEQKLANLKSKMRVAYQEEVGKMSDQLSAAEEKVVLYQKAITKLKSERQELYSRLTSLQERSMNKNRNNDADLFALTRDGGACGELTVQHSASEEPIFALPRDVDRRQSCVVDERITYVRRKSVQKIVPAGMGKVFHEEDEEGEVFNNTYLADVKAGRCNFGREDSGNRISELQYRNSLCPPHLKSSYPAETQFHDPTVVKDDDIKRTYNKPGPPTPGKKGRLSLQGSEASHTPRSILKEFNESTSSRKGNTPSRFKALFSTKSTHRDENMPVTPRGRGLSLFKKPTKSRLP